MINFGDDNKHNKHNKLNRLNNKKCPKCHGSGKKYTTLMSSTIYIPEMGNPAKKKNNPLMCDDCDGTGYVQLPEPIRM